MRMPRKTTYSGARRHSYSRSFYSSEEGNDPRDVVTEVPDGNPVSHRNGLKQWCLAVMSVLVAAMAVAAVGSFCALLYPIFKELRVERVRGPDGTEAGMFGFWSILVLSVMVGSFCCVFSWTLTSLEFHHARMVIPFTLAHLRHTSGFHLGYGMAVLNGIMGSLTVIWSLT